MKALTEGRYRSRDGNAVLFDVSHRATVLATIRVSILERDIGRVTLKRAEGYRLDRGWSIAPNNWSCLSPAGRGTTCQASPSGSVAVTEDNGIVTLSAEGLIAEVTYRLSGSPGVAHGQAALFLEDRRTQAYLISRKTGALVHFMTRHAEERHYGLGDKAGPSIALADASRIDAVDPCGFDAECSDPLYKILPVLYRRWAYAGARRLLRQPCDGRGRPWLRRSTTITACSAPTGQTTVTSTITSLPVPPCRT